ncbi:MAG: ComEC/Rec2 family competence protein [Richelia sp.]|nr:ComEC/Rec2 family competence protein [Richelia sp.]
MIQASGVVISLAFILGLLFTVVPGGGIWLVIFGLLGAILFSRRWAIYRRKLQSKVVKKGQRPPLPPAFPHPRIWLIAGVVGLLASFYLQFRFPQPGENDISKFVPQDSNKTQAQLVIIRGKVENIPRLTRSQRGQFWLNADQLSEVRNSQKPPGGSKAVSGKLYVTVPILQSTGLYPGQQIEITGVLYQPKGPANPGGFDFRKYLQRQGSFAGLSGRLVNVLDKERPWGWWEVRQGIVRSHAQFLGVPQGPLVSAMVLGSKAVDLPYNTRDLFVKAGLAHAIAASGFHTSLLLALVLAITKRAGKNTQLRTGSLALIVFLILTGFQPSVLRAVLMGFAALLGIGLKRKVKQLGSLLVVAVILLLINPLWIWDLGFQLSFLATLGLIVTVPAINQRLQWLPTAIASLIAVPVAATIWTLPIQLSVFGVVPTYSIVLNILSTPFITIVSIGGMVSAVVALIFPPAGSAVAGMLNYPTTWLISLVELVGNLPGNSLTVGKIAIWQLLTVYTLILLVWWVKWWKKRWWFAGLLGVILVVLPIWHSANNLFRITVLAAAEEPVMVIQDRSKVTVFNSGDRGTGKYAIAPFLQKQGVNKIDWAIYSNFQPSETNAWLEIMEELPIKVFFDYSPTPELALTTKAIYQELQKQKGMYQPLSVGQTVRTDSLVAQLIDKEIPILQMQIRGQLWLFIGNQNEAELDKLIKSGKLPRPQILWYTGQSLKKLLETLEPPVAIAVNANLSNEDSSTISKMKTQVFFPETDGAIQWTPDGKFEAFIQDTENRTSVL